MPELELRVFDIACAGRQRTSPRVGLARIQFAAKELPALDFPEADSVCLVLATQLAAVKKRPRGHKEGRAARVVDCRSSARDCRRSIQWKTVVDCQSNG